MISSTLALPSSGVDPDVMVDIHVDTKRRGDGRLDHRLAIKATRRRASLWTKEVTFEVDAPFDVPDLPALDPFVIAALFPAMEVGGTVRVHGKVSRALIRNILDFNSAWHLAAPHLCRLFTLEVAEIDDSGMAEVARSPESILAFTGGVDSMLALCQNASGDAGPVGHEIGATMMIRGKGIGRGVDENSAGLIQNLRHTSQRWNVPLAVVSSNIAEVVDRGVMSHGTWIASCLSLFAGRFDIGLIGSSKLWFTPGWEVYGSHPLLDPLLSSGHMSIRDDGALYHRSDKVALLAKYPTALEDLRVCFHPYRVENNCCRCEKCIRTMLCFIANGEPIPPVFPDRLRLSDIGIGMGSRAGFQWVPGILECAKRNGTDQDPAIRTLRRRYRSKRLKVATKGWLRRLTTGQAPPHWYVFDDVSGKP